MPTEVLTQLRALREGIAETLRKDPRYLTLSALDKSIAEISSVLSAVGLIPPEAPAAAAMHFEAPSPAVVPAPDAVPAPAPAPAAVAPSASPAARPAANGHAPAPAAAEAPVKKKKSVLKPMAEAAAVIAAGGLAAELVRHEAKAKMGKAAPRSSAPEPAEKAESSDAEDEGEPAAHDDEAETEHPAAHDGDEGEAEAAGEDHEAKGASHDSADAEDEDTDPDHEAKGASHDSTDAEHEDADDEDADPDHEDKGHAEPGEDADEAEDKADDESDGDADGADAKGAKAEGTEAEAGDGIVPKGKASGYTPMAAKPGAAQYQPSIAVKFGKLPNKVDLRPLMTPIEDQGDTNSCVANAVAGAYEYWIKKASKTDQAISRLFVYYNARWRDNSQDKDAGSVIQLAMEGLSKFGACHEKVWPFDPHLVLKKPGADAYKDGATFRVQDMQQVPLKLDAWKQALAEGKPIVFGIALFDSFDECSKKGGVVPMPSPDDVARAKHSGHSMCVVGYSDSEKVFIVRNSWGADWGDKGYCYMPYSYLMNPKFNDNDCWVFVPKVPSQPPREVWSDTTDPVTNSGQGVDFPIETYTVADYENVVIDLFEDVRRPFNATIVAGYADYVSSVGRGLWSELDQFDFRTFLASTAALTGVAAIATEVFSSETETSETNSESEESLSESEESEESSEEESESDEDSEDSESDDESDDADDADSDDESEDADDADSDDESDDADDADSDDESDDADDADSDDESDDADDADSDDESDDADDADSDDESDDADDADSDDESDDADDADSDDADESDDSDEGDDDDEADADDSEEDDDGGGDDDDGGDDDSGGDDDGGDDE